MEGSKSKNSMKKISENHKVQEIPLELIDRPSRPIRESIDPEQVRELAESIKEIGLQQPIIVIPINSRYKVVAGDRRLLAHKIINEKTIKAIVKDLTEKEIVIIRATENLQRADLNPIEEARIYSDLKEKHGMTRHEIAKKMGKSPPHIESRLKLLELPEKLQDAVGKKRMQTTVALELMKIQDIEMRDYYLEYALANGITFKVAQEWVSAWEMTTNKVKIPGAGGSIGINPLEKVPAYMPCNFCNGPVDIQKIVTMHICPECAAVIKKVKTEE